MKTTYIKPVIEQIVLQDFMELSRGLTRASTHDLGNGTGNKFIIEPGEPGEDDYIDDCAKLYDGHTSLWED